MSPPLDEEEGEHGRAGQLPFHPTRALFAIVMAGPVARPAPVASSAAAAV